MNSNKKIYIVSGVIVLVALLIGGFVIYSGQGGDREEQEEEVAQPENGTEAPATEEGVEFRAAKGFIISYAVDGGIMLTERYPLYNRQTGDSIDISAGNAEITVITPDGETRELNNELISFYPLNIIPPSMAGEHKISVVMHSGKEYEKTIQFNEPQEVELESLEGNRFSLGGLELGQAEYVMHVFPGGDVFDAVLNNDNDILLEVDDMKIGEHIIMAKINNTWHYARVNYPDDF